jgi:hypothetical protein
MSDPFDVLRRSPSGDAPDVGAIKGRARRIERRRRVALSSAAIVIAAVAVGGLVLRPNGGSSSNTLAQRQLNRPTATAQPEFNAATSNGASRTSAGVNSTTAASSAAAQKSSGAAANGPAAPEAASAPAADRSSAPLELKLAAQAAGPHRETFTLQACNPNDSSVAVTFPSGQRYDFEVRSNNALVWRWSDGMAFTQMYGQESWAPKQCKTYTATWNGTNSSGGVAPTGGYTVTGILTSSPRQSTAPKAFCLDLC